MKLILIMALVGLTGAVLVVRADPKAPTPDPRVKVAIAAFDLQMSKAVSEFRQASKRAEDKLAADLEGAKKAAMLRGDLDAANNIAYLQKLKAGSPSVAHLYESVATQQKYWMVYTTGSRKGFRREIRLLPFGDFEDEGVNRGSWFVGTLGEGATIGESYLALVDRTRLLPPTTIIYCSQMPQQPGGFAPMEIFNDPEDARNIQLIPAK